MENMEDGWIVLLLFLTYLDFPSFSGMNHIFKDISDILLLNVHMNLIDDLRLFNKEINLCSNLTENAFMFSYTL